MHRRLFVASAILSAGALLASTPSPAWARRARFNGVGLRNGARHGGPVLSRDELRGCIEQERMLNAAFGELEADDQRLRARQAEIEELGGRIDRQAKSLDRTSQKAVDGYNAQVRRHQKLVKEFNAALPPYNARVDAHSSKVASFNSACANKAYYESDMSAVQAALK